MCRLPIQPILAPVLAALLATAACAQQPEAAPRHLLISGNIVTPDGVIPHGWLDIANGHVLHIEREKPDRKSVV